MPPQDFSDELAPATSAQPLGSVGGAEEPEGAPAASFVRALTVSLFGAILLALASRVPLFEIGDTAVVGHVYAWGVDGSWNNVEPALGRGYVNGLEIAQWIAAALVALGLVAGPALRRPALAWSALLPIALIALACAQARALAPFGWHDVVPLPAAFACLLALSALLLVGHRRRATIG